METIKQESSTYIASFLASFKLFCLFSFFFLCKNIESFVLCSQCRGKKVKQIWIIKYDNISNRIDSKKKKEIAWREYWWIIWFLEDKAGVNQLGRGDNTLYLGLEKCIRQGQWQQIDNILDGLWWEQYFAKWLLHYDYQKKYRYNRTNNPET